MTEEERFQEPLEVESVTAYCHKCKTTSDTKIEIGCDRKYPDDFDIKCGNDKCDNWESGAFPVQNFDIIE